MDWNEFWVYLLQGIIVALVVLALCGIVAEYRSGDNKKETDKS